MKIASRDWQDMLDKLERVAAAQERIATATEVIAKSQDAAFRMGKLAKDARQQTADLSGALPAK